MGCVTSFLQRYRKANQRDGRPCFGALENDSQNRHVLVMHINVYKDFEFALRRAGIKTEPIPQPVINAITLGSKATGKKGAGGTEKADENAEEGLDETTEEGKVSPSNEMQSTSLSTIDGFSFIFCAVRLIALLSFWTVIAMDGLMRTDHGVYDFPN